MTRRPVKVAAGNEAFAAQMGALADEHRRAGSVPGDGLLLMDDGERIKPSELVAWYEAHPNKIQAVYHTNRGRERSHEPSVLHMHDEACFPDEPRQINIGGATWVMSRRCVRTNVEVQVL
jgi:hypothetical protein